MGSHLFVVNTHSGGGRMRERMDAVLAEVSLPGDHVDVVFTEGPGHATRLAREAAGERDTLIAVGGDGTVGEVATGILSTPDARAQLAILPSGTGNDAALTLGIPDWPAGIASLQGTATRGLDVVQVHYQAGGKECSRFSLIGTGIGLPASVTTAATERVKRVLGRWAYVYAAFVCITTYRAPRMRIEADGQVTEGRFPLAAVVNMEWTAGHSLRMAPGALYDDGELDVILLRDPVVLRLATRLGHVMRGTHIRLPEVSYFRAKEVTIESDPPSELMVDADLVGTTPARFRVLPGALRVRVPGGTDGS